MGVLTEAVAIGDWTLFASEMERVAAVTRADLERVCQTYLVDRNLTVGWFIPAIADRSGPDA
jgi:hypothetical protein